MSKTIAVLIAGLFAAGAYAQNPSGTSPEQANSLSKDRGAATAQQRVETRPAGMVPAPAGDIAKMPESGAIGTDKAAQAGEKRAATRDDRRRNKDGTLKRRSTQGGTPDMKTAK